MQSRDQLKIFEESGKTLLKKKKKYLKNYHLK